MHNYVCWQVTINELVFYGINNDFEAGNKQLAMMSLPQVKQSLEIVQSWARD